MAKERLSRLQKIILLALYQLSGNNTYEREVIVGQNDKDRIAELEAQGYSFSNAMVKDLKIREPSGELKYKKELPDYKLARSKLLYKVNRWEEYNSYTPESYCAATVGWKRWQKGLPPHYHKKQAAFSRSLQILAGKDLVDLLSRRFDGDFVNIYGAGFAKRLGVEPRNFKSEREEALKHEVGKWLKESMRNTGAGSFEEWFNKPISKMLDFGQTTRKAIFESWHSHRGGRNIKAVRLTPKGVSKAENLLKVNFYNAFA